MTQPPTSHHQISVDSQKLVPLQKMLYEVGLSEFQFTSQTPGTLQTAHSQAGALAWKIDGRGQVQLGVFLTWLANI